MATEDPVSGELGVKVRALEAMEADLRNLSVGQVPVWNGAGWDGAAPVAQSLVDAKGDLIGATGNDTPARVPVGADATSLIADAAQALGMRYKDLRIRLHHAQGSTSNPTTTSTANPMTAVMPEMTITADFGGFPMLVFFNGQMQNNTSGVLIRVGLYDGTSEVKARTSQTAGVGQSMTQVIGTIYTPAAGSRTMTIRWNTSAGTATAVSIQRDFIILGLRHTA